MSNDDKAPADTRQGWDKPRQSCLSLRDDVKQADAPAYAKWKSSSPHLVDDNKKALPADWQVAGPRHAVGCKQKEPPHEVMMVRHSDVA